MVLAKHTLSSDRTPNAEALLNKLSDKARQDNQIIQAANELATLAAHIRAVGMSVSIDVTELSGYHYHTGVVFNAYLGNRTTQTKLWYEADALMAPQLKAWQGVQLVLVWILIACLNL